MCFNCTIKLFTADFSIYHFNVLREHCFCRKLFMFFMLTSDDAIVFLSNGKNMCTTLKLTH